MVRYSDLKSRETVIRFQIEFAAKRQSSPLPMPQMKMTDAQAADIQDIVKRGFASLKGKPGTWPKIVDPRFKHGPSHAVCRFHHNPVHPGGFQAEFYDHEASVGPEGELGARRIRGCYGTKQAWQKIVDVLCVVSLFAAADLTFRRF